MGGFRPPQRFTFGKNFQIRRKSATLTQINQTYRQTDRHLYTQTDIQTSRKTQPDNKTSIQTYRHLGRQIDTDKDRQTPKKTDTKTDTQTDRLTDPDRQTDLQKTEIQTNSHEISKISLENNKDRQISKERQI